MHKWQYKGAYDNPNSQQHGRPLFECSRCGFQQVSYNSNLMEAMQNTVTRTCDECGNSFEVREDIAVNMDAWAEQGEPYVCTDCLPQDPYAEDEPSEYEQSGDLEDGFDETAERFPDGDDPMMHHLIECKCRKCDVEFEVKAGETAWCPECHIHKDPARPPATILEDVDIQVDNEMVILCGSLRIYFHGCERPMLFMHVFRRGEKAAAKKAIQLFSEPEAKPQRLKLYFEQGLISDVEDVTPPTQSASESELKQTRDD